MKAIILAGGLGTRISEETHLKPKPMIEIGGMPILWHIMKIYEAHGINEFIICCGYKGYMIKEYFANYFLHMSDVTFDMSTNKMHIHNQNAEPWKVTLVDTGESTQTGGRIKRIKPYIDSTFCLTYGDGVTNLNIKELIKFHKNQKTYATVTASSSSVNATISSGLPTEGNSATFRIFAKRPTNMGGDDAYDDTGDTFSITRSAFSGNTFLVNVTASGTQESGSTFLVVGLSGNGVSESSGSPKQIAAGDRVGFRLVNNNFQSFFIKISKI